MSFVDQIRGVLQQYQGGSAPPSSQEASEHYDAIAKAVPQDVLKSTIGSALGSLGADQVRQRVSDSASQMSATQRAGLFSSLLTGLTSSGVDLPSVLSRAGVSPAVKDDPSQASPQDVGNLAAYAKQNHPDIFQQAMGFYAQHPMLVKAMGTIAIAAIAKHLFQGRPGLL